MRTYKTKSNTGGRLVALLAFFAAAGVVPAAAQTVTYHVTLNTSGLIPYQDPSLPFGLDFQLNDGSGTLAGVNTVKLWGFKAGSGGSIGSQISDGYYPLGNASGDLTKTATLTDDIAYQNEIVQNFTAGDKLSFYVSTTTNSDGSTPDELSFATGYYDPNYPGFIDSTTSGPGNAAFTIDLDGHSPTVSTYATADFSDPSLTMLGAPIVTNVPEPGSIALFAGLGVCGARLLLRRRYVRRG